MTKVIDNVLPEQDFLKLQSTILDGNFPWYYRETLDNNSGWHLSHVIYDNGSCSFASDYVVEQIKKAIKSAGQEFVELYRVRLFMLTNVKDQDDHIPHIDGAFPHQTGLIYLNDSDGNTKIYNESYDPFSMMTGREHYEAMVKGRTTIDTEIEPRANRMVTFDGMRYHSGSNPLEVKRRVILNFNYRIK